MLQINNLATVLREINDRTPIIGILLTTLSFDPTALATLLQDIRCRHVTVLFQRWSYSPPNPLQSEAKRLRLQYIALCERENFRVARYRNRRGVFKMSHMKSMWVTTASGVLLLYFSSNITSHMPAREVIYSGTPVGAEAVLDALHDFWAYAEPAPEMLTMDMHYLGKRISHVQDSIQTADSHVFCVLHCPTSDASQEVYRRLRDAEYMKRFLYTAEMSRSQLVMHFPYVSAVMMDNSCPVLVRPFCVDLKEMERTDVRFAYPKDLDTLYHEKYAARIRRGDIEWLFLTSHNLSTNSWGRLGQNLEMSLLILQSVDRQIIPPSINEWILRRVQSSERINNALFSCTSEKIRRETDARPVQKAPSMIVSASSDAWSRFASAWGQVWGMITTTASGALDVMVYLKKQNLYARFAAYHIIFQYAGGKHSDRQDLRYHSVRSSIKDALRGGKHDDRIMDILTDLYIKWSKIFTLYDARFPRHIPEARPETLTHLGEAPPGMQVLEDPAHARGGNPSSTTHDTTSFLVQQMFSGLEVWWQCALGHRFYFPIDQMMLSANPSCIVCAKAPEIQLMVNHLCHQRGVELITVEFPLFQRTRGKDENRYCDSDMADPCRGSNDISTQTMFYDIFFYWKGSLVTIEFDDASHLRGPIPESAVPDMVADKSPGAHRDAVKNVISHVLGVHLVRFWVKGNNRSNAMAQIPGYLDDFLSRLDAVDKRTEPWDRSRTRIHEWVLGRLGERVVPASKLISGKNPPLSLIYQVGPPGRRNPENALKAGKESHPLTRTDKVGPCRHMDARSVCQNVTNFSIFIQSLTDGDYAFARRPMGVLGSVVQRSGGGRRLDIVTSVSKDGKKVKTRELEYVFIRRDPPYEEVYQPKKKAHYHLPRLIPLGVLDQTSKKIHRWVGQVVKYKGRSHRVEHVDSSGSIYKLALDGRKEWVNSTDVVWSS